MIAVFYGLQIGPIGTRRIFANMIITILLSIFVTQPLVILILAGIKTTIFKVSHRSDPQAQKFLLTDFAVIIDQKPNLRGALSSYKCRQEARTRNPEALPF